MARTRPEDLEAVDALMAESGNTGPQPAGPVPAGAPQPTAAPASGNSDPQRLLVDIQAQLDQLRGMLGGLG